MTKSEYLSNSAKILMICSIMLFVSNALVYMSGLSETIALIGSKASDITFYVVFIIGFLAFNGEGIAYKRSRDLKSKKKTVLLKFIIAFVFILRYIKSPIENIGLSVSADSLGGTFSRLGLGLLSTVASYGFVFLVCALLYLLRDNGNKKLLVFESIAFLAGVINNIFKVFRYSVTKYGLASIGDELVDVFSNETVTCVLSLSQFALCIVMFSVVVMEYNKLILDEYNEHETAKKRANFSRQIYNTDCIGIDTMEDDFLVDESLSE